MNQLLRVEWRPGSDELLGRCHCGAESAGSDPAAMWEWLLTHPEHPAGGPAEPAPALSRPPARRVTDPAQIQGRTPVFPAGWRTAQ